MPLTLTIRNASQLDNGSPIALVLDRRGATIGRGATSDWCLPDPALHISSRHCEIRYADERYELIDHSTNGTFMLGEAARLGGPRTIGQGDVFVIGRFEVEASLDDAAAAAAAQRNAAPQMAQWQGWGAAGGGQPAPLPEPEPSSGWGATPAAMPPPPASDNWGASNQSQGWSPEPSAPPAHAPAAPSPAGGGWGAPPQQHDAIQSSGAGSWPAPQPADADQGRPSTWAPPPPPPPPASGWSSPIENRAPPANPDVWGKFAASNVVDWARGGFGSAPAPAPPPPSPAPGSFASHAMEPPRLPGQPDAAPPAPPQPTAPPAAAPAPMPAVSAALAGAAGIDPGQLRAGDAELLAGAGNLLRRLVSGMVVMLEARARAKSQMGAQGTSLEFDGNNPLKFARTPEQALVQLLNPPERGFMASDRAIEDAFKDLQAHQMATLMAMQGALRATLERFSPSAIRARAEKGGLMSRILPAARDQALWAAYEKEFSGVAKDSDEAFMDMFAKEFRRAYDDIARKS